MSDMTSVSNDVFYSMFKGEPGTRKSTQALSYPKPMYWLSYDWKMRALNLPMKAWGINPKEIVFDDLTDWESGRNKLEKLQVDCPYKTVVVDSVTSLADSILRQTMKLKSGKSRSSGAAAGKMIGGIPVQEIEDFNAEASALSEMVALTKDIHKFHKINVILIAHVIQVDYKELSGVTHVSRSLVTAAKKIAAKLPAYCDEVYHFNVESAIDLSKGGEYALLTLHTGADFARTTLPLDSKIVFGNEPLYKGWIEPAIKKLKDQVPTTSF